MKCEYCKEEHKQNNTGCKNSGYRNSGNYNSGDRNSGYRNSGNHNSGDYNSGYRNSGNYNSGDYNSGNYNSGDYNSGNYNSGYRNSGNYNSGDYNSGNYNSGYRNSGWFNTNEPKMRFFNNDSEYTYSEFSEKFSFVYPDLKICAWVEYDKLSDKDQTKEAKQMGGLLKTLTYKEAWAEYWGRASESDKKWFQNLPNFTPEIFKEITGIDTQKSLIGQEVEVKMNGKIYKAKVVSED